MRNDGSERFENVIVLSDEFYAEAIAHPIPTDMEAVKVLASAPAVLDLFMWLVYRCFVAKREEQIPLFGEFGLTAQFGSVEYTSRGVSAPCYSNGYLRSTLFGQSAPPESALRTDTSPSGREGDHATARSPSSGVPSVVRPNYSVANLEE